MMASTSLRRKSSLSHLLLTFILGLILVASVSVTVTAADAKDEGPVIGIDLGTTYSCVGIVENGKVEIIPNDQGNRITPSYVSFTDSSERLVGDAAKNQAAVNPLNTVFDVKRLIGRRFNEPTVQRDKKLLPFNIMSKDDKPHVKVLSNGEDKIYSPEEISAMVLTKLKKTAEDYLGRKVTRAVVTVPAYFNDAQRAATKDAGIIAGLNVLRIINEPTAAALAYGLDKTHEEEKNILVFDLGGGTFDVTLLTIEKGVFEVLATSGDTHLGGEDFDQRLMEYFVKLWEKKYGDDMRSDKRALGKLRREVEKAKRELSTQSQVRVEIESLFNGKDLSETLTRSRFEQLNDDLFKKTLKPVAKVLKDSGLSKDEVNEVVLVGGSTRIPKIKQLVSDFFDGKDPHTDINPDEAIAFGAAIQAGILSGNQKVTGSGDIVLLDVTPLSLGIETLGGVMSKIIKRNTVVPTKKSESFTTTVDNQETIAVHVYEGERAMTKDCHLLSQFDLTGIKRAPKGQPQVIVTFEIDENGMVKVSAEDKASKNKKEITIEDRNSGRLSQEDVERMVKEAEEYADEDAMISAKVEAKQQLESYINTLRSKMEDMGAQLASDDKTDLEQSLSDTEEFVKEIDFSSTDSDVIEEKRSTLEELALPLLGPGAGYQGKEDL